MKYTKEEMKPVEKIELNEKHIKLRVVLFVLSFCVVIVAAIFLFIGLTRKSDGWTTLKAESDNLLYCDEDFVLQYNLGTTKKSATVEAREIVSIYTEAMEKTYMLFDKYKAYSDIANVYFINHNMNTEIEVDSILYDAIEKCLQANNYLYFGPIYAYYENIFSSFSKEEAMVLDPFTNVNAQIYFERIISFIENEDIKIELLENHRIKLYVSQDYRNYVEEDIPYIDFAWLKNAFIVDYVSDCLITNGYTNGNISSYDGFFKNLDTSGNYNFILYILDLIHDSPELVGQCAIRGSISVVQMRSFMFYDADTKWYEKMPDSSYRNLYLDAQNGLCKTSLSALTAYSNQFSCSEIALTMASYFISDYFEYTPITNIDVLWCENDTIYYTDSSLELERLFQYGEIEYKKEVVE